MAAAAPVPAAEPAPEPAAAPAPAPKAAAAEFAPENNSVSTKE